MIRLTVDSNNADAAYRQVYRQLRAAILSGELPPGSRLPATRALARASGIARVTVVEAYRQLEAEGFTESRVGAGTFVAAGVVAVGGVAVGGVANGHCRVVLEHDGGRVVGPVEDGSVDGGVLLGDADEGHGDDDTFQPVAQSVAQGEGHARQSLPTACGHGQAEETRRLVGGSQAVGVDGLARLIDKGRRGTGKTLLMTVETLPQLGYRD